MSLDFSYFDQFKDTTIDLSPYLVSMSTSGANYSFSNVQPIKTTVSNLFTRFDIADTFKGNINLLLSYTISEDENIEATSYKVYGKVDYWWVIAVFNNIKNVYLDWPANQDQIVNFANYMFEAEGLYSYNTYFNFIHDANEVKRTIIIPRPSALNLVISAYRTVFESLV